MNEKSIESQDFKVKLFIKDQETTLTDRKVNNVYIKSSNSYQYE